MSRVGLATCAAYPQLEAPDRLVIEPLAARGVHAVPVVWDDPDVDWASLDLVVLRSTWDYVPRREQFLAWVDHVDAVCGIANPPELVRWNTDKRYLRDLEAAGIPIVPTTFIEPGGAAGVRGEGEVVVKPAISVGSQDTGRYDLSTDADAADAHIARLLARGRTVMVQPYVVSVDDVGETALLHLGGRFSHAIRKGALLQGTGVPAGNGLFVEEQITPRTPSSAEREVTDRVMAEVSRRGDPLYVRVDLLATEDGPVVLECELTEPSLFIDQDPGAPARFADAIVSLLG